MITIYLSEDYPTLVSVDTGEVYLIPFPEEGKHPKTLAISLRNLLYTNVQVNREDIAIMTHSKDVLDIVIDWLEDQEDFDHRDFSAVILGDIGSRHTASLETQGNGEYYLTDWPIGFFSYESRGEK